jgi:hypothetical protein
VALAGNMEPRVVPDKRGATPVAAKPARSQQF